MTSLTKSVVSVVLHLVAAASMDDHGVAQEKKNQFLRRRTQQYDSFLLKMGSNLCLECEFHSSKSGQSSRCYDDDKLVMDECNTSARQRFVYEPTEAGNNGRIRTEGNDYPSLCITRVKGNTLRLKDCNNSDEDQIFEGFDLHQDFELSLEPFPSWCVAPQALSDDEEIQVEDCENANDDDRSVWKASNVKGPNSCPEVCLKVSQDSRKYTDIRPVSTNQNIVDFYDYRRDNYSFNGDDVVPLKKDHSLLLVHQDASDCQLSLVVVHDSKLKDDCSGGEVLMWITGNLEDSIVQDGRNSPSDTFRYSRNRDETECYWEWDWQTGCRRRTDGIAHYWYPKERNCIYVTPEFIKGIDRWQLVPGMKTVGQTIRRDDYLPLKKTEKVKICYDTCGA